MEWKKRKAEIARLKAKHGKDRSKARSFPDLKIEHNVAPLSNRLDHPTLKHATLRAVLGSEFTVSHLHKSGYQVMLKREASSFGKKV
jgi:hypothetical protein